MCHNKPADLFRSAFFYQGEFISNSLVPGFTFLFIKDFISSDSTDSIASLLDVSFARKSKIIFLVFLISFRISSSEPPNKSAGETSSSSQILSINEADANCVPVSIIERCFVIFRVFLTIVPASIFLSSGISGHCARIIAECFLSFGV